MPSLKSIAGQYTRHVEGKTDTMVEVGPGEFVNMVSAAKLGMIADPKKVPVEALQGEPT
jgi:hypothetical protein